MSIAPDEIQPGRKRPIYMDHHATTPVDPRVLEAMLPYFTECFGNAASVDHIYGAEANRAVEKAREQVAQVIGAQPQEIIFTSGATESDNLAILGVAEKYADRGRHIITCVTEHKAVLDPCRYLETKGYRVTYLPVDHYGLVDPDDVRKAITSETILISIMTANNEIGTIAPIAEIGRIAKEREVLFHTDAAQAFGHIPMDVHEMGIDLLSLSGHKIYGPKGAGALYVRRLRPRVRLAEQMHGGGHERGTRSGTLNVPGIAGLGAAASIAAEQMVSVSQRLRSVRDRMWDQLRALRDVDLNGHRECRLPHNLSVYIAGVDAKALVVQVKYQLAISAGSACTSASVRPSYVIEALGYGEARATCTIRIGLGRGNTIQEAGLAADVLLSAIADLRRIV